MDPQLEIGKSDIRDAHLPSDMYAAWVRSPKTQLHMAYARSLKSYKGAVFQKTAIPA